MMTVAARFFRSARKFHVGLVLLIICVIAGVAIVTILPTSNAYWYSATNADASMGASADPFYFETGVPDVNASLVWWLDASKSTTLYADASCSTASLAGGAVGCWADRRPGYSVVTTPGTAATRSSTPVNGIDSVLFNGTAVLAGPDLLGGQTGSATIFLVVRENVRRSNFLVTLNGDTVTTTGRFSLHVPWSSGIYYFDAGDTTTDRTTAEVATAVGTQTLVTAWQDPTETMNHLQINRGTIYSSPGSVAASTIKGLRLGYTAWQPDHDIAELLVFSTTLSATQREQVNAYLKQKWGTP